MCSNRSWKRNFLCSPTSTRVESGFAVPQNTFWCPYLIAVKSIVLSAFILLVPAMPEDTPFSWNTLAFRQGKKLKCSFSFTMYFYSTWVPLHFSGFWRQENQKIEFSQGILPTFIHKRRQLQKACADTFAKQSIKAIFIYSIQNDQRSGCTGNFEFTQLLDCFKMCSLFTLRSSSQI